MTETLLLETYLKQLRLPLFAQHYRKLASEAAQTQLGYEIFFTALAEQEVRQREKNQQVRRIQEARFPILKDLAEFDFSVLPNLNKTLILDLARGSGKLRVSERTNLQQGLWICGQLEGPPVAHISTASATTMLSPQRSGGRRWCNLRNEAERDDILTVTRFIFEVSGKQVVTFSIKKMVSFSIIRVRAG